MLAYGFYEERMKRALMLAAAPLSGFAQGAASAPLSGKLPITGSFMMARMITDMPAHSGSLSSHSGIER